MPKRKYIDNPNLKLGDIILLQASTVEKYQKEKRRMIFSYCKDKKIGFPVAVRILEIYPYVPGQGYTQYDIEILEKGYVFRWIDSYILSSPIMEMFKLIGRKKKSNA